MKILKNGQPVKSETIFFVQCLNAKCRSVKIELNVITKPNLELHFKCSECGTKSNYKLKG